MNLEPGDKVSFINEKLNGTVKYRIDKQRVMLELEDGFDMPANVSELVLVQKLKANSTETASPSNNTIDSGLDEAVFLSFTLEQKKFGDARVQVTLMNNTPYHLVYLFLDVNSKAFERFYKGDLPPFTTSDITGFPFPDVDNHKNWQCRLFYFNESMRKLPEPVEFDYKLKPANLMKTGDIAPELSKPGFTIKIPFGKSMVTEQPQQSQFAAKAIIKPAEVIDLHADYILGEKVKDKRGLLDMQLLYFRNNMEKGIAAGMDKMTFIHGIGHGILKQNLISVLNDYEEVARWEEADHKKYGYGALSVYFKTV